MCPRSQKTDLRQSIWAGLLWTEERADPAGGDSGPQTCRDTTTGVVSTDSEFGWFLRGRDLGVVPKSGSL